MTARRLEGNEPAARIEAELARRIEAVIARPLPKEGRRAPSLAAVALADDPLAGRFVDLKRAAFERAGMTFRTVLVPRSSSETELCASIDELGEDVSVDGIFVQYPLPGGVDSTVVFDRVPPARDVDGCGRSSLGRLVAGDPGFVPATPAAILHLLAENAIPLLGTRAVVVGPSRVAAVTAVLLLRAGAEVRLCDVRDPAAPEQAARARLLVVATGAPESVDGGWIGDHSVVVDAGYDHGGGLGDIDLGDAERRIAAHVPARGGLGPLTISMLMRNTVRAWEGRVTRD